MESGLVGVREFIYVCNDQVDVMVVKVKGCSVFKQRKGKGFCLFGVGVGRVVIKDCWVWQIGVVLWVDVYVKVFVYGIWWNSVQFIIVYEILGVLVGKCLFGIFGSVIGQVVSV